MSSALKLEFNIQSDPRSLPVVRSAVERLGEMEGFGPEETHGLAWAIDEALANVIKHGYDGRNDQTINIQICTVTSTDGKSGVLVEIKDHGRQVDPCTIRGRPLDEIRPGGLGVHIIQSVMDQFDYSCPQDGGMLLRMVKYKTGQQQCVHLTFQQVPWLLKPPDKVSIADLRRGGYTTIPMPDSEHSQIKQVRKVDDATVVTLTGDIDLHRSPALHAELAEITNERPERLVIDLKEVPYMDSSGVGTLVEILRRVTAYKGKLVLCNLSSRVRSVFEITKLNQFFTICDSEEQAKVA